MGQERQMVGGSDQDGGVVECEAHLLPRMHQKYLYMWNDSH